MVNLIDILYHTNIIEFNFELNDYDYQLIDEQKLGIL